MSDQHSTAQLDMDEEIQSQSKGNILKAERENKGLSLETVHESTKIPMDALRAIEEGYTIRALSSFYYRGFIKIYARYLGIDPDLVLEPKPSSIHQLPKLDEPKLEINLDIQSILRKFLTRERKRQILFLAGILFSLFLLFKIIGFFTSRPSNRETKKSVSLKEDVNKEMPKVAVNESKKPASVAQAQAKPAEKSEAPLQAKPALATAASSSNALKKSVTLTIRALKKSWVRVKADGNVVFQSTLNNGAVETWNADDSIEISGKNIDQLEFELNGKLIGTLGRKDRNAKTVLVTKDGLKVTQ